MTQTVIPIQLATRIADVTDNQYHRYALFVINGPKGKTERIFQTFRSDIRKMTHPKNYKLAWFKSADSLVVLVSGYPLITNYVYAFAGKGGQRKLFQSADVLFEGVSVGRFKSEIDKLLAGYAPPAIKHSFGGTN
jgi:hypothetical protein